MFRPSRRRFTLLLLLALAFVTPWQTAAEAAGPAASPGWQPWGLAAQLWNAFLGFWSESGCSLDPSGVCGTGSQADHGCSNDPNGRCASGEGSAATTGDHGCSSDPNGGCGQ